jgi:hypothetical protein
VAFKRFSAYSCKSAIGLLLGYKSIVTFLLFKFVDSNVVVVVEDFRDGCGGVSVVLSVADTTTD